MFLIMLPVQSSRRSAALAVCVAALALIPGCGGGAADDETGVAKSRPGGGGVDPSETSPRQQSRETVSRSHCHPGVPDCRATIGRIIYVERVDPDGDGDAHFVVVDPQGITLPGITAIDVRKGLRPHPLPEYGDLISAAGPVQTGSHGQSQIHALELRVAGR